MIDQLLRRGQVEFQPFAVALSSHGCKLCFVSDEADFLPILSAQPQVVEPQAAGVIAIGPSMTTESLAANRAEGADFWTRHDAVVERLGQLAAAQEIVASAVAYRESEQDDEGQSQSLVQVELEHASGWTLLWSQPYQLVGGEVHLGEVAQYDHDSEVFHPEE
jgi:hypothetical protein